MLTSTLVYYPDQILRQKCQPLTQITADVITSAETMLDTMYRENGIGLAAPQVGRLDRLLVMDVTGPQARRSPLVCINPVLVARRGAQRSKEGCLSLPTLRASVARALEVDVTFLDREGKEQSRTLTGLEAICFQHEIEHLDGILFIDHLSTTTRTHVMQRYRPPRALLG